MVCEIQDSAKLLEWAMKSAGKEGPLWFDCGVLAHSWCDDPYYGTSDTFQIGKEGEIIELDDILSTLRAVGNNKVLDEVRYDFRRSYYLSGYRVSKDGKTIKMLWSS